MVMDVSVTVTERGWPGHYCCAPSCLFRRNTLIQGPTDRVIVSSVGHYRDANGEVQEVGLNRYYETMVFGVKEEHGYLDADVEDQRDVDGEWGIFAERPEDIEPLADGVANDIHEAVVQEFVDKLSA